MDKPVLIVERESDRAILEAGIPWLSESFDIFAARGRMAAVTSLGSLRRMSRKGYLLLDAETNDQNEAAGREGDIRALSRAYDSSEYDLSLVLPSLAERFQEDSGLADVEKRLEAFLASLEQREAEPA